MVSILHLDERVVAVAKPSGLFVHRSKLGPDRDVLLTRVRDTIGRLVFPIHRLDRAVSGVVLFGLSSEAARAYHDQLKRPDTRKTYVGLARGITPLSGVLSRFLSTSDGSRRRFARTDYERLGVVAERHSLLLLMPLTGRRHQIRRQLAREAHHLIGDTSYGKGRINQFFRESYGLPRLALHALRIEMIDPCSGEPFSVEAPIPDDLHAFFGRLPGYREEMLLF